MHVAEGEVARDPLLARLFHRPRGACGAGAAPGTIGFAGFWIQEVRLQPQPQREPWATFLGASYFAQSASRGKSAVGARADDQRPSNSARRNFPTSSPTGSAPPRRESDPVIVNRLLDGPQHLWRLPVQDQSRSSSWSWTSTPPVPAQGDRADGHRPADLDVLVRRVRERALSTTGGRRSTTRRPRDWNGAGERIWRPLNNPPGSSPRAFSTRRPRASA